MYTGRVVEWAEFLLVVTAENLVEKGQKDVGLWVPELGTAESVSVITVNDMHLTLEILLDSAGIHTSFQQRNKDFSSAKYFSSSKSLYRCAD